MDFINIKFEKGMTHYCGREGQYPNYGVDMSILGNPFPPTPYLKRPKNGKFRTHDESIRLYRLHIWNQQKQNSAIWKALISLPESAILGCFCKPAKVCHCETIISAWKWSRENS